MTNLGLLGVSTGWPGWQWADRAALLGPLGTIKYTRARIRPNMIPSSRPRPRSFLFKLGPASHESESESKSGLLPIYIQAHGINQEAKSLSVSQRRLPPEVLPGGSSNRISGRAHTATQVHAPVTVRVRITMPCRRTDRSSRC